jgi:hypothetical protein
MRKLMTLAMVLGLAGCGTLNFGGSAPPVYVVFFPDHSTDLTKNGQKIVSDVAEAARMTGARIIQLTGPSTKIAPGYDPSLAEPRIHTIELALIADGVAEKRLVRASETTDGVDVKSDPSGAQRVEIRLVDRPAN